MNGAPNLSVVVPFFNEATNVAPMIRELASILPTVAARSEVLCVDDGSTDGTGEELERVAVELHRERAEGLLPGLPVIRVLRFDRNHGQSAALDAGFRRALAPVVATMDGDMQNDPRDLAPLLEALDQADVACGVRLRRQDNFVRRLSSRIANGVRDAITGHRVRDTGCSLKVYRRALLEKIRLYRGMHRFLPTLLALEGARVVELPVSHRPRQRGRSKYGIGNRAWSGLVDCLAVRWMRERHLDYRVREIAQPSDAEAPASADPRVRHR